MSTDRDVTRIVRSWLEDGATALPDRVLDNVLDQLPATPQRRSWWPVRRFGDMNTITRFALAAAALVVVAVIGVNFLPGGGGSAASGRHPARRPPRRHRPRRWRSTLGRWRPARTRSTPFGGPERGGRVHATSDWLHELPADDSIRITYTVPEGFEAPNRPSLSLIFGPNGDTGLVILRGASLYSDPCHSTPPPDVPVGPTVDDFVNALVDHADLDVTAPVDVTLAGYTGKYVDLQLPADTSACTPNGEFWPYGARDVRAGFIQSMAPLRPRRRGHPGRHPGHGLREDVRRGPGRAPVDRGLDQDSSPTNWITQTVGR